MSFLCHYSPPPRPARGRNLNTGRCLSSFSDPGSRICMCRNSSEMGSLKGPRCPHCDQLTAGLSKPTPAKSHKESPASENGGIKSLDSKLSLQEALMSIQYEATNRTCPVAVKRLPERGSSSVLFRSSSFLARNKIPFRRASLNHKAPQVPRRPERPAPTQCPPLRGVIILNPVKDGNQALHSREQQYLQAAEWRALQHELQMTPASAPQAHRVKVCETCCGNKHHELAYSQLTGSEALPKVSLPSKAPVEDACKASSFSQSTIERSDSKTPQHGSWFPDTDHSFSTLSTTASKLALQPSPLRLPKDEAPENTPPVSASPSHRHTIIQSSTPSPQNTSISGLPRLSRAPSLSYTTASIYSSDDEEPPVTQDGTPPSSPPPLPPRSLNRCLPRAVDSKDHAKELGEELKIIDDAYDMFIAPHKNNRNEALTDHIQGSQLPSLSKALNKRLSKTKERVVKEHARSQTARQPDTAMVDKANQDAYFEDWLNSTSSNIACDDDGASRGNKPAYGPARQSGNHARASKQLADIPEDGERKVAAPFKDNIRYEAEQSLASRPYMHSNEPSALSSSDTKRETIRLNSLRARLLAFEDGDESDGTDAKSVNVAAPDAKTREPPTRQVPSISSSDTIDDAPENPLRIEIILNGKRYPALMGADGKVWEGPCTDNICTIHRRQHYGQSIEL